MLSFFFAQLNSAQISVCVWRGRYFAQIRYSWIRCCLLSADSLIHHFRLIDIKDVGCGWSTWYCSLFPTRVDTKYLVINLLSKLFIFNIISKWTAVDQESHGEFRETGVTHISLMQSLFLVNKTNNQGIQGNYQQILFTSEKPCIAHNVVNRVNQNNSG